MLSAQVRLLQFPLRDEAGVRLLPPRRPARKLPKYLEEREWRALLAEAEGRSARHLLFVMLSLYAGLRVSELALLSWSDLVDGKVHVRRGKGGKERYVPMGWRLREHVETCRNSSIFRHDSPETSVLDASPRTLERWMEEMCLAAAIPREKAHPHVMRHTFATNILRKTSDLRRTQELLGHSRIETTVIYTHVVLDHLQEAVDLLD